MTDATIKLGSSTLQHGPLNNRVYLMKLSKADYPQIIGQMEDLAARHQYTKIFAKIPQWAAEEFEKKGYTTEARIPLFFQGREDARFIARYLDASRKIETNEAEAAQILEAAEKTKMAVKTPIPDRRFRFSLLTESDANDLAALYRRVFPSYPFPIFDPAYLKKTMRENVVYFGIRADGALVAAASCEMDLENNNVEMTDFATLEAYRSKGLAGYLLCEMECEMKNRGVLTAYTIARALSYGMNVTFAKIGYLFAGTLINNTHISGGVESMNVWFKPLGQHITPPSQ
ncbi:putative beta-lysine N-acetyltransferase [Oscillospiraceae bacterium CM]|nr:putative beta-lysine N-acetyltransferase [Oscillospiraceae bacterium CM]